MHIMEGIGEENKVEMETDLPVNSKVNLVGGFNTVQEFTENSFKLLIEATKRSNRLPFGKGRDLYESFPCFHNLMKNESSRVLRLLSAFMKHAGCRASITKRDDDEKTEMVVEINDTILEKVGRTLDEISGVCKYPQPNFSSHAPRPISGSWNLNKKESRISPTPILNTVLSKTKNIEKPQLSFKDKINNDRNSCFEPIIKYKFNMLKPLAILEEMDDDGIVHFSHPYEFELDHFKPTKAQLTAKKPVMYKEMEESPLHYIDSVDQVQSMITDLKKYKEIAVDLEHHSYRSFQGFTCLMQLSTRDADYIVDTLVLRSDLQSLNEVFTDPSIVKIFHGADMDVLWLQRDLGIYVVNMFDTHQAAKLLNYPQLSLAYLLRRFCNVDAQKHFQLADWRIRPLPEEFILYARGDTHYLLYIYDNLKNLIIEKANGKSNLLEAVITQSTRICLSRYVKPIWNEEGYLDLYNRSKKLFDNRQKYALKCLFDWRDKLARSADESYGYVLPNHMMLHISEALPREAQGILACCNPIPPLVRQHLLALHQIILKAREQPLIKPVFEEQRLYRSTAENDLTFDNHLRCPHDLNHDGEFRDDLPVLLSNGKVAEVSRDNKLVARNPIVTVFEAIADVKSRRLPVACRKGPLTPYQRYKLTKPFNETQESNDAEAQKIVASNKERIEKMEINAVQSLLKSEPVDKLEVKVEAESLRKRKAQDDAKDNPKKMKIDPEIPNVKLVPNPYHNKNRPEAEKPPKPEKIIKKKDEEIKPFDYSSVDYDQYQTLAKATQKKVLNKDKRKAKLGKKNKRISI